MNSVSCDNDHAQFRNPLLPTHGVLEVPCGTSIAENQLKAPVVDGLFRVGSFYLILTS